MSIPVNASEDLPYRSVCLDAHGQYIVDGDRTLYKNTPEQFKNLVAHAAKKEPQALFDLALCYRFAYDVPKIDKKKCFELLTEAAGQGLAVAEWMLGDFYRDHMIRFPTEAENKKENRFLKAFDYYQKAAAKGLAIAYESLADMLDSYPTFSFPINKYPDIIDNKTNLSYGEYCFLWYKKAADLGLASSQYQIALCYQKGIGTSKDLTKEARMKLAVDYCAMAAKQGFTKAQESLDAFMIAAGSKVASSLGKRNTHSPQQTAKDKDMKSATDMKAATAAKAKSNGQTATKSKDKEIPVQKPKTAATQSLPAPSEAEAPKFSSFYLGTDHQFDDTGHKILVNYKILEMDALRKHANMEGNAGALFDLGMCHYKGYGTHTKKDASKAFEFFKKAADLKFPLAEWLMGELYFYDKGIPKEPVLSEVARKQEAIKWYKRAAAQGLCVAHYDLAHCYLNGTGISEEEKPQAKKLAKESMEKAAKGFKNAAKELKEFLVELEKMDVNEGEKKDSKEKDKNSTTKSNSKSPKRPPKWTTGTPSPAKPSSEPTQSAANGSGSKETVPAKSLAKESGLAAASIAAPAQSAAAAVDAMLEESGFRSFIPTPSLLQDLERQISENEKILGELLDKQVQILEESQRLQSEIDVYPVIFERRNNHLSEMKKKILDLEKEEGELIKALGLSPSAKTGNSGGNGSGSTASVGLGNDAILPQGKDDKKVSMEDVDPEELSDKAKINAHTETTSVTFSKPAEKVVESTVRLEQIKCRGLKSRIEVQHNEITNEHQTLEELRNNLKEQRETIRSRQALEENLFAESEALLKRMRKLEVNIAKLITQKAQLDSKSSLQSYFNTVRGSTKRGFSELGLGAAPAAAAPAEHPSKAQKTANGVSVRGTP